jgi:hypothetical protein
VLGSKILLESLKSWITIIVNPISIASILAAMWPPSWAFQFQVQDELEESMPRKPRGIGPKQSMRILSECCAHMVVGSPSSCVWPLDRNDCLAKFR